MIVKTEAIVLRTMKYRDSSKIATLFTREYGKLSVVAKGARDRTRRFGSSLDALNHVQAVIYKKDGRDLHLLSQCDVLNHFDDLSKDLDRLTAGMTILELVQAVARVEEESSAMFDIVREGLETLEHTRDPSAVVLHLELKLLDIMGFRPQLSSCSGCGASLKVADRGTIQGVLRLTPGGYFCTICDRKETESSLARFEVMSLLRDIQESTFQSLREVIISPSIREGAKRTLWFYLTSHIDGIKPLKSDKVVLAVAS
jgi:DNA repair protein RecO (recombination protein O)